MTATQLLAKDFFNQILRTMSKQLDGAQCCNISGMKHGGSFVFAGTKNKNEVPKKLLDRIRRAVK